ncbi:MAG: DUF1015 domain-containing protein [Chloroflexi bacterium]|nr:DUF1015 domain-containing protein [Chloroflexota bacterium]
MADVRAFRGLRYNLSKVGEQSLVTTPPYDTISPQAQKAYYEKSEYNVIRLELGLDQKGDNAENNKYTRAAEIFVRWQEAHVLSRDPQPSIYLYEQEFDHRGQRKVRRGYLACVRLEEWDAGVIFPHEETLAKPLADRLHLMRACHANFSPAFGLYEDETGVIARLLRSRTEDRPTFELRDEDGEDHRLWVIDDVQHLHELHWSMLGARIYIADGHHRYQTALRYRDQMREKHPDFTGDEAFNFVLMLLVDLEDSGLVVLPTHRLVRSMDLDRAAVEHELQKYFDIEHRPSVSDEDAFALIDGLSKNNGAGTIFGALGLRPDAFSLLHLKANVDLEGILPTERSRPWKDLDVAVLQCVVIEHVLGISDMSVADGNKISFLRDERQAIQSVRNGSYTLSFFLNAPRVAEVRAVALAGDKMPPKSTYFHPKPLTGLVINSLDGDLPRPMA